MARVARFAVVILLAFVVAVPCYFVISASLRQSLDRHTSAPAAGRFVQVDGADVFVHESGPKDGPTVLFVHATIAWGGTWVPTMRALNERGFRTLAIDMPPMGYSGLSTTGYDRHSQSRTIVSVANALQLKDFTLVGHSFGARATLTAAKELLPRLKGLVIASGALGWTNPDGPEVAPDAGWFGSIFRSTTIRDTLGAIATHPSIAAPALKLFVANPEAISDEVATMYAEPFRLKGKYIGVGYWLEEFVTSTDIGLANDTDGIFASLNIPALVVWGDRDTATPPWQAERLVKKLPRARLVMLNGIGHLPQIEAPEKFRETLLDFLAGPAKN